MKKKIKAAAEATAKTTKAKKRIRKDRPLAVPTKPEAKPKAWPKAIQRLAQALKDHQWQTHPDDLTDADQRHEDKIKRLVELAVAKHGQDAVREVWMHHVPAKLPTPFGLKPIKPPKPDKKLKGKFNDPRDAYKRRKELELPDPAGEVENHDRIAEALAVGNLLGSKQNFGHIVDYLRRGELITIEDVTHWLGRDYAQQVKSELDRLQAIDQYAASSSNGRSTVSTSGATTQETDTMKNAKKTNSKNSDPRRPIARKPRADGKMSCLDAAAKVLAEHGGSLGTKEMVEQMAEKGYWSSPAATPHATLYAAILVDLQKRGAESRFTKTAPGQFGLAGTKPTKAAKATSKVTKADAKKDAPKAKGGKQAAQKATTAAKGGKGKTEAPKGKKKAKAEMEF